MPVATNVRLKPIRDAVAGRVICLEVVLKKIFVQLGPAAAAQKLRPLALLDKRACCILSPADSGNADDCLLAVDFFLNGLRRDLGLGFLYEP